MRRRTQPRAACCHDSQYKRYAVLELCLFGSWELQVVAQAFAEESHWMPKQFQQQQSGNLTQPTLAHG